MTTTGHSSMLSQFPEEQCGFGGAPGVDGCARDGMNKFMLKQSSRTSLAFLAMVVLLLIASGVCARAAVRTSDLWWMPEVASKGGVLIDKLTYFIYYLTGAVFVLTQVVYVYFLVKYRSRKGAKATYSHGNNRLELLWTSIPTAIFIGLSQPSQHLW